MRVLVIVAHPDDEMQCAGTIALQTAAGLAVTIGVVCNGNLGGLPTATKEERARVRKAEMEAACRVLGAQLEWLGFGDDDFLERFHCCYAETEMAFRNLLRRARPDLLLLPALDDYHPHHRATAELALNASVNACNPAIVSEEPPTEGIPLVLHLAPFPGAAFTPDLYVDITPVFARKIEALHCHKSQHEHLQRQHRVDVFAQLEAQARYFGAACGVAYAEAFSFCRQFNRLAPLQQLARFFPLGPISA